jgi:hypothetical protein
MDLNIFCEVLNLEEEDDEGEGRQRGIESLIKGRITWENDKEIGRKRYWKKKKERESKEIREQPDCEKYRNIKKNIAYDRGSFRRVP